MVRLGARERERERERSAATMLGAGADVDGNGVLSENAEVKARFRFEGDLIRRKIRERETRMDIIGC
jgi:hypothetical protein